jgi:hypothetical protein
VVIKPSGIKSAVVVRPDQTTLPWSVLHGGHPEPVVECEGDKGGKRDLHDILDMVREETLASWSAPAVIMHLPSTFLYLLVALPHCDGSPCLTETNFRNKSKVLAWASITETP